jgi:putative addiction module antidote
LELAMLDLKIRKIGNSHGVVLPKEVLAHLRVAEGDRLFLTETPEGGYRITPYDPEFEQQLRLAEEGMARYRNTLRALAR